MKGQRYELIDDTEASVTVELNSAGVKAFQNMFTDMYTRFKHCIELGGDQVKF